MGWTKEDAARKRLRSRLARLKQFDGHALKTWPEPYRAAVNGTKRFEFRKDDRGFAVDDRLLLMEWDPATGDYTGQSFPFAVMYIVRGPDFGVPEGFVVLSIDRAVRRGRDRTNWRKVPSRNLATREGERK